MNATLMVLILVAIGVGVVVWAVRRNKVRNPITPDDRDTAWNDPIHPAEPHKTDEPPPKDRPLP